MTNSSDAFDLFELLARILIRCFLLTFILLFISFGLLLIGGNWAYDIHSTMVDMSKHEFDIIIYCGIALAKTIAIMFFLIPYISIRMILKKQMASKTSEL